MEDWAARAIAFVTQHGVWAGPAMGLLVFGESLALIGLFIPATAIMLAVGGLIGAGALSPTEILLWAVPGAALGDWASYEIGRRMGPAAWRRWPLKRRRTEIAKARLFLRRHGFLMIFFGRFLGPARSTVPLVAGVARMAQGRFQIANWASAALWVPVMLAPGWLAARGWGRFGGAVSAAHLLGLAAAILALGGAAMLGGLIFAGGGRRRPKRPPGEAAGA